MYDRSGEVLDGRYKLEKLLGEGGMGQVYVGNHVITGRKVAIKFLLEALASNTEIVGRFYREARAATAVGSKHICEVLDMRPPGQGQPYIIMEYLEGESLRDLLIRKQKLAPAQVVELFRQMLEGLAAAHDVGIIHRDMKPENVFLVPQPGRGPLVKLLDFGVSRYHEVDEDEGLTVAGAILGSPNYMAPEQAIGVVELGPEADIYSVGVMFYELLAGQVPFDAPSFEELVQKLSTESPAHPCSLNPAVPRDLAEVALKAMSRAPAARYPSARDMRAALANLRLDGQPSEPLSSTMVQSTEEEVSQPSPFDVDFDDYSGDEAPTEIAPVVFDDDMMAAAAMSQPDPLAQTAPAQTTPAPNAHAQTTPAPNAHAQSGAGQSGAAQGSGLGLLSESWSPPAASPAAAAPSPGSPRDTEPEGKSSKTLLILIPVLVLLGLVALAIVGLLISALVCSGSSPELLP